MKNNTPFSERVAEDNDGCHPELHFFATKDRT